jgi:hypothetical protein
MYPRIATPATFLLAITEGKTLPVQNIEGMAVYTARHSPWRKEILSVSIPGPSFQGLVQH